MAEYPIYRLVKGDQLTFTEMDDNLRWLSQNMSGSQLTISGSIISITGSVTIEGPTNIQDLTGSLFGTASWAKNATNIYNTDGALTSDRTMTIGDFTMSFTDGVYINSMYVGNRLGTSYDTYNTIIGNAAGLNVDTALEITAIGYNALMAGGGDSSTAVGSYALANSVYSNNTAIGSEAMSDSVNASYVTALGYRAGQGVEGAYGVYIGTNAGGAVTGRGNTIIDSRDTYDGLIGITTGQYNTILGSRITGIPQSTSNNIIISDGQGNIKYRWDTIQNNIYGNLAVTGSIKATQNITASNALITGTITAQTLVVQTITSSTEWITGSSKFGSLPTDTHQFTGSLLAPFITGSLFGTSSWAQNAISSSYPIAVTGSTIYSVVPSKYDIFTTQESVVLGNNALSESIGTNDYSVIIGAEAGANSSFMQYSVLLGYNTGKYASGYYDTVAIGDYSMYSASGDYHTYEITAVGSATLRASYNVGSMIALGSYSGWGSRNMDRVTIIGVGAGQEMENVNESDFIGYDAGYRAGSITEGLYMGFSSGRFAVSSSGTIAIGYNSVMESVAADHTIAVGHKSAFGTSGSSYSVLLGYNVGNIEYLPFSRVNSIGRNNIIIGTNISLPAGRQDSINLGAIIFATGSYFNGTEGPYNQTGNNFSGSVGNGKVGINVVNPTFNLDVSGSGRYTNGLQVTSSLQAPSITGSLFGTASWAQNTITASNFNGTGSNGFVSNMSDTYTGTAKITDIMTLSVSEYNAIGSPSTSTLYIIL